MAKLQLFMFHFAGGNLYSFKFMTPHLGQVNCIPLELPGRGKRINELLIRNFEEAAKDMFGQVREKLQPGNLLLYGHSMGALLAFRVTQMLEERGIYPNYLVVTGNPGPGVKEIKMRHLMEKEEFREELEKLGGMPPEFTANNELFDFFEPVLRADFELAEIGNQQAFDLIRTPIFAVMGSQEEYMESIGNWKDFTSSDFTGIHVPGDHFFIYNHAAELARIIESCGTQSSQRHASEITGTDNY